MPKKTKPKEDAQIPLIADVSIEDLRTEGLHEIISSGMPVGLSIVERMGIAERILGLARFYRATKGADLPTPREIQAALSMGKELTAPLLHLFDRLDPESYEVLSSAASKEPPTPLENRANLPTGGSDRVSRAFRVIERLHLWFGEAGVLINKRLPSDPERGLMRGVLKIWEQEWKCKATRSWKHPKSDEGSEKEPSPASPRAFSFSVCQHINGELTEDQLDHHF